MPLRDHFRPPLDDQRHWEGFHATWPVMMVAELRRKLPKRFFAEPRVHSGASVEADVATFKEEGEVVVATTHEGGNGGVATAVWAPPRPTLTATTDLPMQPGYEVLVFDAKRKCRLVAAVEIVTPANKDRPEHRRVFAAKCAGLLRERVSVVIVDIVTTRSHNLYAELLELIGHNPAIGAEGASPYAAACRILEREPEWSLEAWLNPLRLSEPLPTLPLWLTDDLAVPLELEESYEQSCEVLNLPS
jgi:hypothetical protein